MYKKLLLVAVFWTFCLIVLGAYVRLSDAGLGCPDWPGCYGKLTPHHAAEYIEAAHREDPHGPVSKAKAWKEMAHRYVAMGLGLLIVMIAVVATRERRRLHQSPALAIALVGVVCFQGALGAWTVTLLLKPAIVTAHLIGGLVTLGMLVWLSLRQFNLPFCGSQARQLLIWAVLGLGIVALQILLGGWVSTNYAALACTDFPTCQGQLVPPMAFADAFHVLRDLGETPDGRPLTMANLTAIHWLHRLGALITFCYILALAWRLYANVVLRSLATLLAGLLILQMSLGISNVVFHLPLPVAVGHNAGAAALFVVMIAIVFRLLVAPNNHQVQVSAPNSPE